MEKIAKELKNSDYFYNRINELTIENNELHARIKELEDIENVWYADNEILLTAKEGTS